MKELSLIVLLYLTRIELLDLHAHISSRMAGWPLSSMRRRIAERNLRMIRLALALRPHGWRGP